MRMTTTTSYSEWESLPNNVFDDILDRLVGLGDYVQFGVQLHSKIVITAGILIIIIRRADCWIVNFLC